MSTQEAHMQSCPKPFHKGGLYSYLLGENPPTSGQSYPVGFQYWVDTYYWFMQHVALASCKPVPGTRPRQDLYRHGWEDK